MSQYENLYTCFTTGQMNEAQLHGHMKDDPEFAAWIENRDSTMTQVTDTDREAAIRPNLTQWQSDQSEWFNKVIVGIVGEYAEWRDKQESASQSHLVEALGSDYEAFVIIAATTDCADTKAVAEKQIAKIDTLLAGIGE